MNKYYVSFEEDSFSKNGLRLRNFYCEIIAESIEDAEEIVQENYPDGWKTIYPEGNFNEDSFSMGKLKTLE